MIKKLICWIWGHKTVHKAATGERYDTIDRLTGMPIKGHYYKLVRSRFCRRCGKIVHADSIPKENQ